MVATAPTKCPKRRGNEVAQEAGDGAAECVGWPTINLEPHNYRFG